MYSIVLLKYNMKTFCPSIKNWTCSPAETTKKLTKIWSSCFQKMDNQQWRIFLLREGRYLRYLCDHLCFPQETISGRQCKKGQLNQSTVDLLNWIHRAQGLGRQGGFNSEDRILERNLLSRKSFTNPHDSLLGVLHMCRIKFNRSGKKLWGNWSKNIFRVHSRPEDVYVH